MSEVHLSVLRSLSKQASVITDVVCAMGSLLSVYQTTFSNVQTVFLTFVEQAGRYVCGLSCVTVLYFHCCFVSV